MAGVFTATTEGERALTTASTKTMMEIMGTANVYAKLVEFGISFDGTSSVQDPVLIELYQITASGTGTAATEIDFQQTGGTSQCQMKYNNTVEPTKGSRVAGWEVHPQGGVLLVQYPLGREPAISRFSASQGLAVVYTTASGVTPNCFGYMVWEE